MAADKNFMRTEVEINLLLDVVLDYRVGKAGQEVDWQTVRSKYEDITKVFLEKYPDNDEENFLRGAEAAGSLNKDRIRNKLKS